MAKKTSSKTKISAVKSPTADKCFTEARSRSIASESAENYRRAVENVNRAKDRDIEKALRGSMTKYKNKKVVYDGITFDSDGEMGRYCELKILQRAGEISHLELQPKYQVKANGNHICYYSADFRYYDNKTKQIVVEDYKSPATAKNPTYRLKKKLVEAIYSIKISEVYK